MKKVLLVVNPSSGGEKASHYQKMAEEKLQSYFDEVRVRLTEKQSDATTIARESAEAHYHSVFVMGGDGTVNEGISGLAEQPYRPKFGFFPLGTVNDLARALSISLEPEEAIQNLSFEKMTPLDIGKINDSYFINIVAVGVLPEAVSKVGVEEKTKMGKWAYFISGFKHLVDTQSYRFMLEVDGEKKKVESSTLLIALTNSIGGFETLLPQASVKDGKLHLVYLKDKTLIDTLKAVPDLIKGVNETTEHVSYLPFQTLKISLMDQDVALSTNVDGDQGDDLPVTVQILPSHLEVYCSR